MVIFDHIEGNINSPEWRRKTEQTGIETIELDQWTAQKSRLTATSDRGSQYALAIGRDQRLKEGDIVGFSPQTGRAIVIRIKLNDVMVIDMAGIIENSIETIVERSVELGHALGNQHWPAVVKGLSVIVPLTVDRTVMLSVMETHAIEGIGYEFRTGDSVVPYLAPHEARRLFGGAEQHIHTHKVESR